ncbi:helix-turn-helix domain-containing protein [Candidatus Bathyarchaeota archaeon]|nr:helix-turn-helix domain-containing protein [Candidatus Bathyarchaeota archaeon]
MLNKSEVFKALSSDSRWEILNALTDEPKDINEIADRVGLKAITVRHHLSSLTQTGLVEPLPERKGGVGRPTTVYRITGDNIRVSFPQRDYFLLNQIIVGGLLSILGSEATKEIHLRVAVKAGFDLLENTASENGLERWTLDSFRRLFVEGLLGEMGTKPEVVSQSEDELIFQERNCLFFELVKTNPELICNALDKGFHDGVVKALGPDFEGERLNCMGHGDPYCRYKILWNRPSGADST